MINKKESEIRMQKNDVYPTTIENIASDGNGVCRIEGMAVFVPQTAPGDVVNVKIVKQQKHYAYGIVDAVVSPSAQRIQNDCPAFPQCGGCSFRHMHYEAELDAKRGFVQAALQRIGGLDVDVAPVLAAQQTARYRNKVQFPVCTHGGALCVGFYANRSHRIVPVRDCLLQHADMNQIANACCDALQSLGATPYDEHTQTGLLRHLFLRRSETGTVMLCLVLNGAKLPHETRFVDTITAQYPSIASVVVNRNEASTNVILGQHNRTLFGDGVLTDSLCGVPVRLSPHSFFQINHAAATALYEKIAQLAAVTKEDTLLDLYCGAGTIGLSMVKACKHLIGVETVAQAVDDARHNAAAMGVDNCTFIQQDAGRAARQLLDDNRHIDVAVVDPPRKGCDDATIDALIQLAPKRIVMVSCNPATLARDLKALTQAGYTASTVYPVDMFPRTKHVETVVLMSRNEAL